MKYSNFQARSVVKSQRKRLKSLHNFDIAPVHDLLTLLASACPTVAKMIVNLIASFCFPNEKSGNATDEVVTLQIRARLSMLENF